ncbi:hypothetical protein ACOSQ4_014892 [Xanthoceras sorbifolium]
MFSGKLAIIFCPPLLILLGEMFRWLELALSIFSDPRRNSILHGKQVSEDHEVLLWSKSHLSEFHLATKGRVLLFGVNSMIGGFTLEIAESYDALFGLQVAFDSGFKAVLLKTM